MARYRMTVFAKAHDGRAEELAHWYDTRHIPDLLRVPGLTSAQRFSLRKLGGSAVPDWDFMTIYAIEGDDPMPVIAEAGRRLGTDDMPLSDALDRSMTMSLVATEQHSAHLDA